MWIKYAFNSVIGKAVEWEEKEMSHSLKISSLFVPYWLCVWVCKWMCVWERERERESHTHTHRERERERERERVCVCGCGCGCGCLLYIPVVPGQAWSPWEQAWNKLKWGLYSNSRNYLLRLAEVWYLPTPAWVSLALGRGHIAWQPGWASSPCKVMFSKIWSLSLSI